MISVLRFMMSSTGGLAMSLALGLGMMALIRVEFSPQDKITTAIWDVNPVAVDIEISIDKTLPKLKSVEVPPAPPVMDKNKSERPDERPVVIDNAGDVDLPPLDIEFTTFAMNGGDRKPQPILRMAPIMPPSATKSGYCTLRFDLSAEGTPFNIEATFCSQSYFRRPSIKSVQKWKYLPALTEGKGVMRGGITERIVFNLLDEQGRKIPE